MGNVVSITRAQLDQIDTDENAVRQRLSRIIEHMHISDSERAIAMNISVWRVRNGWTVPDAIGEATHYARLREQERAVEWRKLGKSGFVPAWDDGAA